MMSGIEHGLMNGQSTHMDHGGSNNCISGLLAMMESVVDKTNGHHVHQSPTNGTDNKPQNSDCSVCTFCNLITAEIEVNLNLVIAIVQIKMPGVKGILTHSPPQPKRPPRP